MSKQHEGLKMVLIQDISDVVYILSEHLDDVLPTFIDHGVNHDEAVEWIIREEIERVYCLFDERHHYKHEPYRTIYSLLKNNLRQYYERLIPAYIKVPRLMGDESNIHIEIRSNDLYIWYTKNKQGKHYASNWKVLQRHY